MKKLLLHLVAEFKRLGAVIIFADFNRILINTKKRAFQDANTYITYISEHIRNKEMFHCINIRLSAAWDTLIWLDTANLAGVKSKTDTEEEPEEGTIRGNLNRVVMGFLSS